MTGQDKRIAELRALVSRRSIRSGGESTRIAAAALSEPRADPSRTPGALML
jgi:hypothetical protein